MLGVSGLAEGKVVAVVPPAQVRPASLVGPCLNRLRRIAVEGNYGGLALCRFTRLSCCLPSTGRRRRRRSEASRNSPEADPFGTWGNDTCLPVAVSRTVMFCIKLSLSSRFIRVVPSHSPKS